MPRLVNDGGFYVPDALKPAAIWVPCDGEARTAESVAEPIEQLAHRTTYLLAQNVALARRLEALENGGEIEGIIHRCGWCGGGLVRLPSVCRYCGEHNHRSGE